MKIKIRTTLGFAQVEAEPLCEIGGLQFVRNKDSELKSSLSELSSGMNVCYCPLFETNSVAIKTLKKFIDSVGGIKVVKNKIRINLSEYGGPLNDPIVFDKKSYKDMTISEIAYRIELDWPKAHYSAIPYINAMRNDDYGMDGEKSVVLYFLSNAGTWRGNVAREIKKELKNRIK